MDIQRDRGYNRVHIVDPRLWGRTAGTDFWFYPSEELTTGGAAGNLLSDHGWITTSLVETIGSAADFLSSADLGIPTHLLTNADLDALQSPAIFGDYGHAQIAASILGYQPTKLVCEFYGAMTVHSANETLTGWGFLSNDGASKIATIHTDGTNFSLINSTPTTDVGAADDANWHRFKISLTFGGSAEWFIDDTSQGTIPIVTDLFPVGFYMFASTTNRPALGWAHVWYS